jgi:hypothetical protein
VLSELRSSCLYLHHDGIRYCFKKDPNVTKLVEDAEQEVGREETQGKGQGPVRARIRELLHQRLAGHRSGVVWPAKPPDLPDEDPTFPIGYLPLEFAAETKAEQERLATELFSKHGEKPRRYKNGVALAIPEKKQIEALRRAARYLLAIERVESRKQQLRLTKDQLDQLRERRRTEEAAIESALRAHYGAVWLPRMEGGTLGLEKVEVGGRPLQATGVHERVMELLTSVGTPKVHGSVTPRQLVERVRLGEALAPGEAPRLGIRAAHVRDAFFENLEPPRLDSAVAIEKAIARGVSERAFAYASGIVPSLGADGRFQIARDRVVFGPLAEDEVGLDSGFLMVPASLPVQAPAPGASATGEPQPAAGPSGPTPGTGVPPVTTPVGGGHTKEPQQTVQVAFAATRDQVFRAFPAIANLAEKSDGGKITIRVGGPASRATTRPGCETQWTSRWMRQGLRGRQGHESTGQNGRPVRVR